MELVCIFITIILLLTATAYGIWFKPHEDIARTTFIVTLITVYGFLYLGSYCNKKQRKENGIKL